MAKKAKKRTSKRAGTKARKKTGARRVSSKKKKTTKRKTPARRQASTKRAGTSKKTTRPKARRAAAGKKKVRTRPAARRTAAKKKTVRQATGTRRSSAARPVASSAVTDRATTHFAKLLRGQLQRVKRIAAETQVGPPTTDGTTVIGICGGDGIGPFICEHARHVLEHLLADEVAGGRIAFRDIEGLTIERRAELNTPIPPDTLKELKQCDVILKGPTTTPRKGDPWPNIESANVAMRKELDLFANVRPVKVPRLGINWMFFRENTEDLYALGSDGLLVTDDLAIDFKVITRPGSERIIRMAFEHAKITGRRRVTVVTKANVIKTTDGLFLHTAQDVAREFPGIEMDDWYIDIMTAKLLDEKRRRDFEVLVLPNLYGDILTDEAAELQGGVGTAGAANIGSRYAMFEAIHGSAPRMVTEGRAPFADPSSMIRAVGMLLEHIGHPHLAHRLEMALDICGTYEKKMVVTGRDTGATGADFADYVLETLQDDGLERRWNEMVAGGDTAREDDTAPAAMIHNVEPTGAAPVEPTLDASPERPSAAPL